MVRFVGEGSCTGPGVAVGTWVRGGEVEEVREGGKGHIVGVGAVVVVIVVIVVGVHLQRSCAVGHLVVGQGGIGTVGLCCWSIQ